MALLNINCICGEKIDYEVNPESLKEEFSKMGVIPILISHGDHFVTVYIDKDLAIRSVERVILIQDDKSSVVVKSSLKEEDLIAILNELKQKNDPLKNYIRFIRSLTERIKVPEQIFIIGRMIGSEAWLKRREPIIKMGASFKVEVLLLLKNELKPIYDLIASTEEPKGDKKTLIIKEGISTQFIIGMAQGILDSLQNYMDKQKSVRLEYFTNNDNVYLTLLDEE